MPSASPDDLLRNIAIVVLLGFGVVLLIPPLAARVEAWLSRFAGRLGVAKGGDGFWSGTAVGASLGLVYAPCAGPILAGVITVSASQSFTAGRLAVALSYGIGSAVVLYVLMLGGRRLAAPLARRGPGLQMAMGAVMVVVALAMLGELRHQVPEPDRQRPAQLPRQPARRGSRTRRRRAKRSPKCAAKPPHGIGGAVAAREAEAESGHASAAPAAACRCSAPPLNSSTTSTGSTPPATGR